jgi:hypothetical protein
MSFAELDVIIGIVGSIAVILTLGILAFQINRARKEISRENARSMIRHNNEILLKMSEDSELMDVHIRGQKDFESLSEAERMRWGFWLFSWITQSEQGFIDQHQKNILGLDLDGYVEGLALTLRSNGGKAIWPRMKGMFDPAFCEAVERQMAKSSTTQMERFTDLEWKA